MKCLYFGNASSRTGFPGQLTLAGAGGVRGAVVEAGEAAGGVAQRRPVARLALLPRALPAAPAAIHDDGHAGWAVWHGAALARVHAVTSDLETTAEIMRHDVSIYPVLARKETESSFRDMGEYILRLQNQNEEEMLGCAARSNKKHDTNLP